MNLSVSSATTDVADEILPFNPTVIIFMIHTGDYPQIKNPLSIPVVLIWIREVWCVHWQGMSGCLIIEFVSWLLFSYCEPALLAKAYHWPWALRPSQCPVLSTAPAGESLHSKHWSNLHRTQVNAVWCLFLVNGWHMHAIHIFILEREANFGNSSWSSVSSSWILSLCLVSFRSHTHTLSVWGCRRP